MSTSKSTGVQQRKLDLLLTIKFKVLLQPWVLTSQNSRLSRLTSVSLIPAATSLES